MGKRHTFAAALGLATGVARVIVICCFLYLQAQLYFIELVNRQLEDALDKHIRHRQEAESDKLTVGEMTLWQIHSTVRFVWRTTMRCICRLHVIYAWLPWTPGQQVPSWVPGTMRYFLDLSSNGCTDIHSH